MFHKTTTPSKFALQIKTTLFTKRYFQICSVCFVFCFRYCQCYLIVCNYGLIINLLQVYCFHIYICFFNYFLSI
ncbi:hypothetical protein Hanom_Chr10g00954341 [Helianthus anomalus]